MAGYCFSHQPADVQRISTKYRNIKGKLPVPDSLLAIERMYGLEANSMHGQYPMIWDKAYGVQVSDPYGNVWLDFTSTIFVSNAGHANEKITSELAALLQKPILHSYTYANLERIEYLDYLIANTPAQFEKAFMLSAGTEATEVALKLMRLNGIRQGKRKGGIVCFEGAYHGRTLGAQMMTGNPEAAEWIGYKDPNIHHIPFPYPWTDGIDNPELLFEVMMTSLIREKNLNPEHDLVGFMVETFQGWAGAFYPEKFIQSLKVFAENNNMLVAFDEMQAGFGRTGTLFGYSHYNIEPDLVCLGKGASSGLPLSLVLGSSEVMDLPGIGSMSSTHSANPMCCVAGRVTLQELLEGGLLKNSNDLGKLFHGKLNDLKTKHSNVLRYVMGRGLIAGLIFYDKDGKPLTELCDKVCELAFQRGLLLVHTGRESIKLGPPLSITEDALLEGIDVLDSCISDSI